VDIAEGIAAALRDGDPHATASESIGNARSRRSKTISLRYNRRA